MAMFIAKFGGLIAAAVACVACLICTGTGGGYLKDKYIDKSTDNKKMDAEYGSAIAFCVVFAIASFIHFVLKKIFG